MDSETLKFLLPLLGGFFALLGGVFTFVNGRLKDAEGHEQREAVLNKSAQWIAVAPSTLAIGLMYFGVKPYVSLGLLFLSYVLQARLFLRNPSPVQRIEVLTFGLLTTVLVTSLLFLTLGNLIERIVENQAGILELQRKTIEAMKGVKSSP